MSQPVAQVARSTKLQLARAALARAEAPYTALGDRAFGAPVLPVNPKLAPLLPHGGLRGGSVISLRGSTSVLLLLLAAASRAGSWCALVGMPDIGALAAAEAGVQLSKLALIPQPNGQTAQVVASLLDGIDLVVLGPRVCDGTWLTAGDQRRLTARAKERGAVLIAVGQWPGAEVQLQTEPPQWRGLHTGFGYLASQELTVTRAGRGSAKRPMSVRLTLPMDAAASAVSSRPLKAVGAGSQRISAPQQVAG